MAAVPAIIQQTLGVRNWDDVRNMVHSGAPALSTALVSWNIVDNDKAVLIAGLLVAMASPLTAYSFADNKFRQWLYGVIAAFQAVLIGVVGVVDSTFVDLLGSAMAVLGGMVASTNTPVSRDSEFIPGAPPPAPAPLPQVEFRSTPKRYQPPESPTDKVEGTWRGL
jgi:hypothetical protein